MIRQPMLPACRSTVYVLKKPKARAKVDRLEAGRRGGSCPTTHFHHTVHTGKMLMKCVRWPFLFLFCFCFWLTLLLRSCFLFLWEKGCLFISLIMSYRGSTPLGSNNSHSPIRQFSLGKRKKTLSFVHPIISCLNGYILFFSKSDWVFKVQTHLRF